MTLTGPGGAERAKPSLAIEASRISASDHPGGVWFVSLSAISDSAAVASTIAETLGIADRDAPRRRDAIAAWLANPEALLLLDNCEHEIDTCAGLVEAMLNAAGTGARIIATSREALGVPREVHLPLPPLDGRRRQALRRRAASVDPDFALSGVEHAVRLICQQLDGMPLAIELAAAR